MVGDMGSTLEQAAAALKVLLYVGPIAVYVLWLGLVNSQAKPKLVSARDDFVVMSIALCPFASAPLVGLARAGYGWLGVAVLAVLLGLFLRLLPAPDSGWVIYNLSPRRARMLAERTLRALGGSYRWVGRTVVAGDTGLSVEVSFVPLLRNVTFGLRHRDGRVSAAEVKAFRSELSRRLDGEGGIPSVAGCLLLLGGVALLIMPLWMLSHHSAAIADVMTHFLLS
jgi:hypothetical protein